MKHIILIVLTAALLMNCGFAGAEGLKLRDISEAADWFAANPRNVKDIGDPFVLDSHYVRSQTRST